MLELHNKYDVYSKLVKIINSCKTIDQIFSCRKIINRFDDIYNDDYLYNELNIKCNLKLSHGTN